MTSKSLLEENIDYIINDEGNLVFTAHYLLKRGHCCQSACTNCPYGYGKKADPFIPGEFNDSWNSEADYLDENEDDENGHDD